MKKIVLAVISIVMAMCCMSLSSCNFVMPIIPITPTGGERLKSTFDGYINNKDYSFSYRKSEFNDLMRCIDSLANAAENENISESECERLIENLNVKQVNLIDQYYIAMLNYYSNLEDDTTYETYEYLDTSYNEVVDAVRSLFVPMANSKYKLAFFGDISDEEIEELINENNTSPEIASLRQDISEIQRQYTQLSDSQVLGETHDELYADFVEKNNSLAKLYGYDNYLDYSYENVYYRDFTPTDAVNFTNSLKDNFLPIVVDVKNSASLTGKSQEFIDACYDMSDMMDIAFYTQEGKQILDGFYRSLGDEIYELYTYLMEEGCYYVASGENSMPTAFTNKFYSTGEPYMYFSAISSYCSVSTFVHEFGHYCNFWYAEGDEDTTFELAETHSQGAEWLFYHYIKTNYAPNEEVAKWFVSDQLYNSSRSLYMCAFVGAFEADVYYKAKENGNCDGIDFDEAMHGVVEKSMGYSTFTSVLKGTIAPEYYYRYVVIENPGYYISYSVSLVSAIEFYVMAEQDIENATNAYKELLKKSLGYVSALEDVGMDSPFDSQTFEDMAKAIIG